MTPLDSVLVRCAVQVAVFSLATLAVYAAARRLGGRAAVGSLLWGLVLTLGLTLLAGSPWPRWQLATTQETSTAAPPSAAAPRQPTAEAAGQNPPEEFASPTLQAFTLSDYAREFTAALVDPPATEAKNRSPWSWLVLAAIGGALFSLLRLAAGLVSVRRLSRGSTAIADEELAAELDRLRDDLAVDAVVAVRESGSLSTPATVGWRRPQILLPAGWRQWSSDELRAVLAHELAHIAGRDYLGWVVARLAVAVHFYNPLVRWLAGRLQLEQELAADAAAARLTGGSQQYLQTLAGLALATPSQRVAGPVRTLFPTRSLLMRRVEMLRSPLATLKGRPAAGLKWTAAALLMLVAVGVAGLRPPASVAEEPPTYDIVDLNKSEPIPLTLVPEGSVLAISCFPSAVGSTPELAAVLEKLELPTPVPMEPLGIRDLHQVLITAPTGTGNARAVLRFHEPKKLDEMMKAIAANPRAMRPDQKTVVLPSGLGQRFSRFDESTLIVDKGANREEDKYPKIVNPVPKFAKEWEQDLKSINLWLDNQQLLADGLRTQLTRSPQAALIAPTIEKIQHIVGSLSIDENAKFELTAATDSEESAKQVVATLGALRVLGQNALADQQEAAAAGDKSFAQVLGLLSATLAEVEIAADGADARVVYQPEESVAELGELAQTLLPAVTAARASARRMQSVNNLKRLALAMHNFHDTYGHFPAALNYEYVDPETNEKKRSQHPHSWRVAILPFLEQQALYNAYHFDEPWNSEANMEIANTIVLVMNDPSSSELTNASYFVPAGPGTAFPADKTLTFRDFRDGTSKTILIIEAKRDIPWTKPEDIEIPAEGPLPEFGGRYPGIFLRALGDGSVRDTPIDTDPKLLRAMLTRNGKEVFKWSDIYPDLRREIDGAGW